MAGLERATERGTRWRAAFPLLVLAAVVTNVVVLAGAASELQAAEPGSALATRLQVLLLADVAFGLAVGGVGLALARGAVATAGARERRRLRALVDGGPDLLAIVDDDGTFTYAAGALAHAAVVPGGLGGTRLVQLVVPRDAQRVEEALDEVRGAAPGHRAELSFALRGDDGADRHVRGYVTNHGHDPAVGGVVLSLHDVTDQRMLEQELARQAFEDSLTGLANRAKFRDRVDGAVARLVRARRAPTVLFVDLDDFKTVNDTYGHAVGDALLISVADDLRAVLREGDTAARLGGDEFAILLEDNADERAAILVAQRLRERLLRPRGLMGLTLRAGGSIGVAPGRLGWSTEMLLRNADIAMYEAKREGGHGIATFEPGMYEALQGRMQLREDFERTLTDGGLDFTEMFFVDDLDRPAEDTAGRA